MNPKREVRKPPAIPALVWIVPVLLFIVCSVYTESFHELKGSGDKMVIALKLGALTGVLACIYLSNMTVALCVFTTVAFFEPILPMGGIYAITFFSLGSIILWFRARKPRFGVLGILFLLVSASIAYNFARKVDGNNSLLFSTSIFYGCGGFICAVGASKVGRSIEWRLVAMSAGMAATLSVLDSIIWVYLYSDISQMGTTGALRLGPMGLTSCNSAAAGWATGVLAWLVFTACGGKLWMAICGSIVCLVGVVLTRTWGASICLVLCLPFVLHRWLGAKWFFWFFALGAFALVLGWGMINSFVYSQFSVESKNLETFTGRTLSWEESLRGIAERPTGHTMDEWERVGVRDNAIILTPHNAVLQAGVYGGVISLVACLGIMLLVLYKPLSRFHKYKSWSLLSVFTVLSLLSVDVWHFYPVLMLALYNVDQTDMLG